MIRFISLGDVLHCKFGGSLPTRFLIFSASCRLQTRTESSVRMTIRLCTPRSAILAGFSLKTILLLACSVVRSQLAAFEFSSFGRYDATARQPPTSSQSKLASTLRQTDAFL